MLESQLCSVGTSILAVFFTFFFYRFRNSVNFNPLYMMLCGKRRVRAMLA